MTDQSHVHDMPTPQAVIAALEGNCRRHETACGDGALVWRQWGAGDPVVLLHGGSGSWMHWIRTIPALARRYAVYAVDLPGLGDSAMPHAPHTPATCGSVVAAGLRDLLGDGPRPHLVTFSFGAHVGTMAAAELGPALRSLVISGCAALGLPHARPDFAKERTGMSAAERAAVHRNNLSILMIAEPARIDDLAIHIQATNMSRMRFRSRPFAGGDEIRRTLPQVTAPLGAIWGEKDQIALPSVEARLDVLRESHPDLVARIVPDAGHWAMYEQPDAFNAALLDVLAKLEART